MVMISRTKLVKTKDKKEKTQPNRHLFNTDCAPTLTAKIPNKGWERSFDVLVSIEAQWKHQRNRMLASLVIIYLGRMRSIVFTPAGASQIASLSEILLDGRNVLLRVYVSVQPYS